MEAEAVRAKIKEIIADVANLDPHEIADDASFVEDLNLDSLSLLEIGVDVDYEFKLGVPDEELKKITSVQEAVELVERFSRQQGAQGGVSHAGGSSRRPERDGGPPDLRIGEGGLSPEAAKRLEVQFAEWQKTHNMLADAASRNSETGAEIKPVAETVRTVVSPEDAKAGRPARIPTRSGIGPAPEAAAPGQAASPKGHPGRPSASQARVGDHLETSELPKQRPARVKPLIRKVLLLQGITAGCACLLAVWSWRNLPAFAGDVLDENPVIQRHLGKIDRITWGGLDTRGQWVFRVNGEKGTGVVQAAIIRDGGGSAAIGAGTLELPSGVRYDLLAASDLPLEESLEVGTDLLGMLRNVMQAFQAVLLKQEKVLCEEAVSGVPDASGPYYVDQGDGTVKDTKTGLIWLAKANCLGRGTWQEAMDAAAALESGRCGLTDGSKSGDWGLPTKEQWEAVLDTECATAPKIVGNGGCFCEGAWASGVEPWYYWSSTTTSVGTAWDAIPSKGSVANVRQDFLLLAWPVRDGR